VYLRSVSLLALTCALVSAAEPAATAESGRAQVLQGLEKLPFTGTSGRLILAGGNSFALAADAKGNIPAAGGFLDDDPAMARILVFAHDGIPSDKKLLANAVSWASGLGKRAVILSEDATWIDRLAPSTSARSLARKPADLVGAGLIFLHGAAHLDDPAWTKAILAHLEHGGGLILATTTWAQDEKGLATIQSLLKRSGLRIAGDDSFEIEKPLPLTPPSPLLSIQRAGQAVAGGKLSAADQLIAYRTLESALDLPDRPAVLDSLVASLAQKYGHIAPTAAKPYHPGKDAAADLRLAAEIVEMNHLPVDQLFVHPSAAAFPGIGSASPPMTRDITFRASSPPKDAYVNEASHGTWRETGLYAEAGKTVTVRVPAAFAGKGLKVMIGIHEDNLWRSDNAAEELLRFPSITRSFEIDKPEVKIGSPFGGLIRFFTDPGTDLGEVTAKVEGAVESPVYVMGKTTPAEWAKERAKPGQWGYLVTPRVTLYVQRAALVAVEDPAPYARHWDEVMRLGDEWLGYGKWRQRPDCAVQDVQVAAGLHHSGYPLMLGPGDGDHLIVKPDLVAKGDWGVYHELGHGFQSCFHDGYTLATHAEVDVNLLPGIVYTFLHHRTPWDGETHSTFDGPSRLAGMKKFLALPESKRTWETACESEPAYDFQFGLAEAFGWDIWKNALGRLMAFDQNPKTDPEIASLTQGDEGEIRRDRLFLCLCAASKSNLLPWFQRYGLGKGNFPLGSKVLALTKALPEWSGNRPITAIEGPGEITTATVRYKAIDPDPGQIFEWDIPSGNADHLVSLDKRSGELTVLKKPATPATLTLRVRDCGVPRTEKTLTVTLRP